MSEEHAEVRIKLVVDDKSEATTKKLKEGLEGGDAKAKNLSGTFTKLNSHLESHGKFLKQWGSAGKGDKSLFVMEKTLGGVVGLMGLAVAGSAALGAGLLAGATAMAAIGWHAIGAADHMDKQVKSMAGLMSMMDGGKHSMGQLKAYAGDLREELAMAGTKLGVTTGDMTDIFNDIIERGQVGTEKAKQLTEQMALVGRVVPGGARAISEGFEGVEMGMIRAKNPIAQLIASTGTLKGSAKSVAAQMMNMTQEKRLDLAQKAIAKQAENMKKAGAGGGGALSMTGMQKGLENMKEMFWESMGQPMLDHILPPLNKVYKFLEAHVDDIKRWGTMIGDGFSQVIDFLSDVFGGVYAAVKQSWGDIEEAGSEVSTTIKDVWQWVTDHQDDIVKGAADWAKHMIQAGKWIIDHVGAFLDKFKSALRSLPGIGDKLKKDDAAVAQKRAMMAAHETGGGETAGHKAYTKAVDEYNRLAKEAGLSAGEMQEANRAIVGAHERAAADVAEVARLAETGDYNAWAEYFNKAVHDHDTAAVNTAAQIVGNNKKLQDAIVTGGAHVEFGTREAIRQLGESMPELGEQLKKLMKGDLEKGGVKAPKFQQTFTGAINIHQDFKDADPEAVALVFRRDLMKHSLAMTQARGALPGGM